MIKLKNLLTEIGEGTASPFFTKDELELYLEYNVKFVSFKHDLYDNDIDLVKNLYFEI